MKKSEIVKSLEIEQRKFKQVRDAYKNTPSIASHIYVNWSDDLKVFLAENFPQRVSDIQLLDRMRIYPSPVITDEQFEQRIGESVDFLLNDLIEEASKSD